jgi:hypothetical protein
LNIDQIKEVFSYPTVAQSSLDKAKDFWIFSYLCNGINMNDIARLRWNNIHPEIIVFEREKTKRTKRDSPVKIVVLRNDHIDLYTDPLLKNGAKKILVIPMFLYLMLSSNMIMPRKSEKKSSNLFM